MRALIGSAAFAITALLAVPQAAVAQGGNEPFCLKTSTGSTNCIYRTMAQCEEAMKGQTNQSCAPRAATTGSGAPAPAPAPAPSPSR